MKKEQINVLQRKGEFNVKNKADAEKVSVMVKEISAIK